MIIKCKNCKLVKEGSKWTHIQTDSSKYKTIMKIARDDSFDFNDGDTLYIKHIGKSYFQYIEDENEVLEFRNSEIMKYFNNAIAKDYIYRFLREYIEFKKYYIKNGNLKTQKTIAHIDKGIIEYTKSHHQINLREIMGNLNPLIEIKLEEERIAKIKLQKEMYEKIKIQKEAMEALDSIFAELLL